MGNSFSRIGTVVALWLSKQSSKDQEQAEEKVSRRRWMLKMARRGLMCGMVGGDITLWQVSKGCYSPRIPQSGTYPLEALFFFMLSEDYFCRLATLQQRRRRNLGVSFCVGVCGLCGLWIRHCLRSDACQLHSTLNRGLGFW